MIPYGKHSVSDEEIQAVSNILKDGWLTQGPCISEFESEFSKYCGVQFSCAVNSATSALHLAYLALGVGSNKTVWTSANTFVATSNAALMCGASVDFIDIDISTGNLCLNELAKKLELAERTGNLPNVLTVVHFSGHPVQMEKVAVLANKYGFKVVEDASHAVGAHGSSGETVGSCKYSDITVFSFHPVKIMTTAEGGMLTTNNEHYHRYAMAMRSHGIDKDLHSRGNSWEFDQTDLGYNYRMSDIQAAIGLQQLKKVDEFLAKRRDIAKRYDEKLCDLDVQFTVPYPTTMSSYHLYPVLLNEDTSEKDKASVFGELRDKGIGVNVHYKPVYLNSYYQNLGFKTGLCPSAESFYLRELSIPIYPDLNDQEQEYVIESIKHILR